MVSFELDSRNFLAFQYAVINPLQIDEEAWADLETASLVPDRYREQAHLFPRLVCLASLDAAARDELLARARIWDREYDDPYFSALLHSTRGTDYIRGHLIAQMEQYHLARREYDVIRLHDPKVFRHLNWLLSADQWESLLGPIDSWAWREPDGIWWNRTRDARITDVPARMRLSPEQWTTLLRFGEINQTLTLLSRIAPDLADDASLAQRLNALLAEAWNLHRLADRSDRLLYASQAIRFHPRIHQHPELQVRLKQTQENEATYADLCSDLDDTTMQRLVDEMNHPYKERV
ncbi:hypothetical protein [Burkholderia oklahomensis]|uniref:hypothetical protein n=1 Tax=Burkholderia oklahomensis TaxID=342113 RepID=UPI00016A89E8|nr:hypothetical protein [Burkholderia oklahomensis]AJX31499.1 hypothetical protein BG90_47 [Burkholderia oklahomensis C6786]AOI46282.1 hypothetical protein WI23_11090 [Burkholderia oklahomensis C6786]KUY53958.1 hypothetical protein WI23_01395 [Burkholderia oklahomensis C6786]MBI0361133.1 hypothetical protein [Burkholderia oklahomensis]SUW54798.1 Uncharacterised protein [Burkholderia oklahomensis]